MTNSDTASNSSTFQAETIIPRHFFSVSYDRVLNSIDGVLTRSERRLLSLFAFRAYKDGEIFPKQGSIAQKLRICVRQVRRIISSLIQKGFIKVVSPSLVDRHCYGKGNRYHLLNNSAYDPMRRMSSERSFDEAEPTINKKKWIKKEQGQGVPFDPYEFVKQHLENGAHVQSVIEALNGITAKMESIGNPKGYGDKIVKIQSGNHYSADLRATDEKRKQELIPNFLGKLGLNKAMPTKQIKTQNDLHQEVRAMKGLPDRKCGVSLSHFNGQDSLPF